MTIRYILRKPQYPVIADIDGKVIAGLSGTNLINELNEIDSFNKDTYDVIDSTGEVWLFSPIQLVISPLSFKKDRTKKELIILVNSRTNKSESERPYSVKSISAKRYETVFNELRAQRDAHVFMRFYEIVRGLIIYKLTADGDYPKCPLHLKAMTHALDFYRIRLKVVFGNSEKKF